MKWLLAAAVLALSGCPTESSYPLQVCETYDEPCSEGFECIGFHCIAECSFEGDCDPGFRCVGEQCLQSCEETDDCTIGVCEALGDERPGSACALRSLPACATDDHCGWAVCVDGQCVSRCDWVGQCGFDMTCDFRRGEYGICEPAVSP